ncbi:F-box/RNI-like/FBD-like domains-containing protein [Striga asiatica]|uniref:F-box/RNI-like/FBD-like domains-containing protein n=1 Tax=Striga asiatica TaxID=4170 RepID=A0A5A7Q0U8_STRAF|nr:F-box/RNI-like/FBD-like domains-containing protein [Striga asiatica]
MSEMSRELSIDMLSSLPDAAICHILSFLKIKIIMRHKAKTLHTLRLGFIRCNEYQLETWVTTAMERNIRNLHIDLGIGRIAFLHQTHFTCKTMVDMRLDNAQGLPSTGNIFLPSLKKLHLSKVVFEDDEALQQLLSGCPMLQELILNDVFGSREIHSYVNLSSSTIKRLELSLERICRPKDLNYKILIDAPAVRCLRVGRCDLGCIVIPIDMTSLLEANICFRQCCGWKFNNHNQSNLVEFFNHLHQIRCLKISCCCYMQVVGSIEKFNNLTKLELQLGVEWQLLVEFLEVADNLQVLIVTGSCRCIGVHHNVEIRGSCMEPKQVPKCLPSSLKTIAIKQPCFDEHELDLVCYLLRNSQVLERMEILPRKVISTSTWSGFLKNDLTEQFKALQRIVLFERGSKACQLVSEYWTEQVNGGQ